MQLAGVEAWERAALRRCKDRLSCLQEGHNALMHLLWALLEETKRMYHSAGLKQRRDLTSEIGE